MSHSRGGLMAPISRKRKEREGPFMHPIKSQFQAHTNTTSSFKHKPSTDPVQSNRVLAGYLAHEFLTQGTLLGHKPGTDSGPTRPEEANRYGEVARLMKTDGAHVPGIVNPTQLARWVEM